MLATSDAELLQKVKDYALTLKEEVKTKNEKLKKVGYEAYMEK
jgi:5-(carboxyamino)imidazole ribonucleotide mutase